MRPIDKSRAFLEGLISAGINTNYRQQGNGIQRKKDLDSLYPLLLRAYENNNPYHALAAGLRECGFYISRSALQKYMAKRGREIEKMGTENAPANSGERQAVASETPADRPANSGEEKTASVETIPERKTAEIKPRIKRNQYIAPPLKTPAPDPVKADDTPPVFAAEWPDDFIPQLVVGSRYTFQSRENPNLHFYHMEFLGYIESERAYAFRGPNRHLTNHVAKYPCGILKKYTLTAEK